MKSIIEIEPDAEFARKVSQALHSPLVLIGDQIGKDNPRNPEMHVGVLYGLLANVGGLMAGMCGVRGQLTPEVMGQVVYQGLCQMERALAHEIIKQGENATS